jgi:uncharacterized membrane protein
MKTYARPLIIVLAAVVLAAAAASLYVHYRLINDPTYSSFCDVNATVSCQSVFQSEYGSVFGVPVAAGGAIWALLVLLLAAGGLQARSPDLRSRVGTYIFVLGTAGLAAVFYFAYASFVVLGQACILCMTMYAGVIGVFLVSAGMPDRWERCRRGLGRTSAPFSAAARRLRWPSSSSTTTSAPRAGRHTSTSTSSTSTHRVPGAR